MRQENLVEIAKLIDEAQAHTNDNYYSPYKHQNAVMDPKYGQKYIVPIPEHYITLLGITHNLNDQKCQHLFDDLFQEIVIKNPDLRRFQSSDASKKFDVVMGVASWLLPRDIEYFLTVPMKQRPDWINDLNRIARDTYGDKSTINKFGYKEWVAFVYTAETALKIIEDHTENLEDWHLYVIDKVAREHPKVIPFRLHALINN